MKDGAINHKRGRQGSSQLDKLARMMGDDRERPDPRAKSKRGVIASSLVGFKFTGKGD